MADIGWVTEEEADTYFATRLNAAAYWTSGAQKEAALQTAYNQLTLFGYYSFPTEVSNPMKIGQMEQALFLLQQGSAIDLRMGLQAQGVANSTVVGETYRKTEPMLPVSPHVLAILKPYEARGAGYMVEITRDEEEPA